MITACHCPFLCGSSNSGLWRCALISGVMIQSIQMLVFFPTGIRLLLLSIFCMSISSVAVDADWESTENDLNMITNNIIVSLFKILIIFLSICIWIKLQFLFLIFTPNCCLFVCIGRHYTQLISFLYCWYAFGCGCDALDTMRRTLKTRGSDQINEIAAYGHDKKNISDAYIYLSVTFWQQQQQHIHT